MEILRRGEVLAQKCGTDGLGIVGGVGAIIFEQGAVGLHREDDLSDAEHDQRINATADYAQDDRGTDGGPEVAQKRAAGFTGNR